MDTSGVTSHPEEESGDDEELNEALLQSIAAPLPDQEDLPEEAREEIKYEFRPREDAEKIRKCTKYSSKLINIELCDFDTKLQYGQLRELNQKRVQELQKSILYSVPNRPCRVTLVEKSGLCLVHLNHCSFHVLTDTNQYWVLGGQHICYVLRQARHMLLEEKHFAESDIPEVSCLVEALVLEKGATMDVRHAAAAQSQYEQRQTTATLFSEQARAFLLAARAKIEQHQLDVKSGKVKVNKSKRGKPEKFYPKLTDEEIRQVARNLGEAVKLEKDVQQMV